MWAHDVAMTGPGPAPASNLPNADIGGVPFGPTDDPPLELGADVTVGELKAFSEAHDFKVWLSARDQSRSVPSLGLALGGEDGKHTPLGHNPIKFSKFSNEGCLTASNELIFFAIVLECICVKACHDPQYHVTNPEYGLCDHRKYGLVLSSDGTYKVGYGGNISWKLTASCVIVVNLSNDTSRRNFFSETCDARARPLVDGGGESIRKGGSPGGVAGGWNVSCQSLRACYIPEQRVPAAPPSPRIDSGRPLIAA